MTCTVCGKPYPCVHTQRNAEDLAHSEIVCDSTADVTLVNAPVAYTSSTVIHGGLVEDVRARSDQRNWREEVALRVNRHRSRHRRSGASSMELEFPADGGLAVSETAQRRQRSALIYHEVDAAVGPPPQLPSGVGPAARPKARKLIRFPKYPAVDPMALGTPRITEIELADPVPSIPEPPRIMEPAPATQMELLPSFSDIQLEETPRISCDGNNLDLPLRPAQLNQRLLSGFLDGLIIVLALGVFVYTVSTITSVNVPARSMLVAVAASGAILWVAFQYLFLVYARSTPGMRATQLELFAFEGGKASLFSRRSRALACGLSLISVGLGFAWALVDEDTLGWHDRISQTYLKSIHRAIGSSGHRGFF